jgi:tyrosine-protein phosphatase YwqE
MSSSDIRYSNLPNKANHNNSAGAYVADDGRVDVPAVIDLVKEIYDRVQCLQRAVVAMCAGSHDFKAEYQEDITEIKRQLSELRRNKVWITSERV